jgi:hypothetical protein
MIFAEIPSSSQDRTFWAVVGKDCKIVLSIHV